MESVAADAGASNGFIVSASQRKGAIAASAK
jgi:hypothetical protein